MRISFLLKAFVALFMTVMPGLGARLSTADPNQEAFLEKKVLISKLSPQQQSGGGYKLVYGIDAPIDIVWKFKTDFDNDILLTNKFLKSHQFISRHDNVVVTEDRFSDDLYTHHPGARFRWQTTLMPKRYRLDFVLLNPEECGQKFHYGHIQLEAIGSAEEKTKVTQVAYFDFFGVFFWINYPWYGGMTYFLKYTARWEQETILNLKSTYTKGVQ